MGLDNASGSFLQDIRYSYNERGWLAQASAPLFSYQLSYNSGAMPQYNGNITQLDLGTAAGGIPNYSVHNQYTYDKLNRLTSGMTSDGRFGENNISYDQLGNITGMKRYLNSSLIDDVLFNYTNSNNVWSSELQSVSDNSADATPGFLKSGLSNYQYDNNGNTLIDGSKGSGIMIGYNILNLPQTITGAKNISYLYDASGSKLRTVSSTAGIGSLDFVSGIDYNNGIMESVQTEVGRAVRNGDNTFHYEYYLSDNIGNLRRSFYRNSSSGNPEIVQNQDYYPFGLRITNLFGNPDNKYLFNGKQLQEDLQQYDYGARFYDPAIGRWTTMDPLAEKNRRFSPYDYCVNNPIRVIDPDGRQWVWNDQTGQYRWEQEVFRQEDLASNHDKFIGINYLYRGDNGDLTLLGSKDKDDWHSGTLLANTSLYKDFIFHREDYESKDIVINSENDPIQGHIIHKRKIRPARIDSRTLASFGFTADAIGVATPLAGIEQQATGVAGILLGGVPAFINIMNGVGNDDDMVAVGFASIAVVTMVNPAGAAIGAAIDVAVGVLSTINDMRTLPQPEKIDLRKEEWKQETVPEHD